MTTLKLAKTLITKLPDNFSYLEGSLDLTDSSISELPKKIVIKGDLIIGNAPVSFIPENTMILGNLNLINSNITYVPSTVYIGGQIISDKNFIYTKTVLPIHTITDNIIVFSDGVEYPYFNKVTIGERHDHYHRWIHFVDKYILYNGDIIYVFQNKWFLYRNKEDSEQEIIYQIERLKRDERVGNKYKHITLNDYFTLSEYFKIYQEITDTCELALLQVQEIMEQMNLDIQKSYPFSLWIEGSKKTKYAYNYLFLEYFEYLKEEAN
jgi:hypothetical protein